MLKILHTADWHLGKRLQEYSRLEEQKLVLDEICQIADRENIDLVLLAGDIFDTFNPTHEAVELLYKTLKRLSKNGTRAIVAISPEAAAGGPIALVEPGDLITVDITQRRLQLHVDDRELAGRRANWQPLQREGIPSYLRKYAQLVTSGSQGAVLAW